MLQTRSREHWTQRTSIGHASSHKQFIVCSPLHARKPQHQQQPEYSTASGSSTARGAQALVAVRSLPRIADFIRDECPIRGLDGKFREQVAQPGAPLQDCCVIQMHEESLLVPGQRQLLFVHEQQLERIIQDAGRAVLACLQGPGNSDPPGGSLKLLSPARGSWAVAAAVVGVQRLPGSSQALVRLQVTDRVAVQALSGPGPNLVLARSALMRDRWCYFVRTAALDHYLGSSDGSLGSNGGSLDGSSSSSNGGSPVPGGGAGRDVLNAVQQVQDASTELLQLLQGMYSTVQAVVDTHSVASPEAPAASVDKQRSSLLGPLLLQHEAAEELAELLTWCELQEHAAGAGVHNTGSSGSSGSSSDSSTQQHGLFSSSDGLLPADSHLMERAWRVSFAPFAAKGLAAALGVDVETGKSSSVSSSSSEVLEMMDLGLRLEAAWELGQALRQKLAAQLSLEQLQG